LVQVDQGKSFLGLSATVPGGEYEIHEEHYYSIGHPLMIRSRKLVTLFSLSSGNIARRYEYDVIVKEDNSIVILATYRMGHCHSTVPCCNRSSLRYHHEQRVSSWLSLPPYWLLQIVLSFIHSVIQCSSGLVFHGLLVDGQSNQSRPD